MGFLIRTLRLGFANLMLHKLRALLTALGIIIGVAAVVAMAAYGEGTKQEALRSILDLGASHAIVRSVKPPAPSNVGASDGASSRRLLVYGIQRRDLRRIEATVGPIQTIVPLKQVGSQVVNGVRTAPAEVFGTTPQLIDVTALRVARGRYLSDLDAGRMDNVAVIGDAVARRLFPLEDPVGAQMRIDEHTFTVIGVLRPVGLAGGAGAALVGRDLNFDVHIPIGVAENVWGDVRMTRSSGSFERTQVELSELIVTAADSDAVLPMSAKVRRVLDQAHAEAQDVTVIVPLELLRQAERTQFIFTVLIVFIAALSLLVGGIGIMNIMLASVTERTREIGIRRAVGATRRHIIAQFLVETTVLSGVGGVIGIAVGVVLVLGLWLLSVYLPEIPPPVFSTGYTLIAFVFAVMTGIVFGLYPAIKAAWQDPIVALRHD